MKIKFISRRELDKNAYKDIENYVLFPKKQIRIPYSELKNLNLNIISKSITNVLRYNEIEEDVKINNGFLLYKDNNDYPAGLGRSGGNCIQKHFVYHICKTYKECLIISDVTFKESNVKFDDKLHLDVDFVCRYCK